MMTPQVFIFLDLLIKNNITVNLKPQCYYNGNLNFNATEDLFSIYRGKFPNAIQI